jgi:hypothetical protein
MLYDQLKTNDRLAADEFLKKYMFAYGFDELKKSFSCRYECTSEVPVKVDFIFVYVEIGGFYFVAEDINKLIDDMDIKDNLKVAYAVQAGHSVVTLTRWI